MPDTHVQPLFLQYVLPSHAIYHDGSFRTDVPHGSDLSLPFHIVLSDNWLWSREVIPEDDTVNLHHAGPLAPRLRNPRKGVRLLETDVDHCEIGY